MPASPARGGTARCTTRARVRCRRAWRWAERRILSAVCRRRRRGTGARQARGALGGAAEVERAAQAAQPKWAATNPQRRARVMFNFKALVEANMDELAHLLSSEHGKVIAD